MIPVIAGGIDHSIMKRQAPGEEILFINLKWLKIFELLGTIKIFAQWKFEKVVTPEFSSLTVKELLILPNFKANLKLQFANFLKKFVLYYQ